MKALKAGASGYLLKNLSEGEFYQALRNLMQGEAILSPDLLERLFTQFQDTSSDTHQPDENDPTTASTTTWLRWSKSCPSSLRPLSHVRKDACPALGKLLEMPFGEFLK